jgi:hypothetical protein
VDACFQVRAGAEVAEWPNICAALDGRAFHD